MAAPAAIVVLPNEILIAILSSFNTRSLLPMTLTSHRFYNLIVRILQTRLLNATALKEHKLILECFHPCAKLSTPYLFVDSLGIGTCDQLESDDNIFSSVEGSGGLGKLRGLYSHFRPLLPEEDREIRLRRRWGLDPSNNLSEKQTEYVSQDIRLESHELFSQLCTITNMVKVGPKRGLFFTCVNIGDGVIRVWRDWLTEQCASLAKCGGFFPGSNTMEGEDQQYSKPLLWSDIGRHVGLRFRVLEGEDVPTPTLVGPNEDTPVSYTLQYEELVIRTTQLLLTIEQSIDQEFSHSAKAVVIGNWHY